MTESRVIPVSAIERRMAEVDARIQEMERAIESLKAQRDFYRSLLSDAIPVEGPSVTHHRYGSPVEAPQSDATLTDQLVAFVEAHPGLISGQIADALLKDGFSSGQNPRKNILTTLAAIASKGRLRKEADGRHYSNTYPVQQPSLMG